ncbi:MAG: TIGR02281 family clan AA aspartic protease [Nitrosomonadales bacterium]|nr:TIGR02281 family clan AA aspartic protease [Nitrosomonadales bacterium]
MKQTILRLAAAILISMHACAWAGTIFKCKNSAGVTQYQEKPCEKEAQAISSWADTSSTKLEVDEDSPGAENQTLVLAQGQGGHYYIDGSVNDNFLNFVVDTGATIVALPLSFASSAGLKCKQKVMMMTANGQAQGCITTIDRLKIGNFTLRYVDAVMQPNLSQPLLGMNVLKQFRVEQDNGQMRLSRKY